jgi:outer membrane protein
MQQVHTKRALGFGLVISLACAAACAQAAGATDAVNSLKLGYAHIGFNTESGDLTGPTGSTPPGVQAKLNNAGTLALVYERKIAGPWSVTLQVGTPPVVKIVGAGNGAALGQVGSARAWFPALLASYSFDTPWGVQPYLGAGANYTFYTAAQISPAYTGAFGGTSSTAKLKSSWGPVLKLGVNVPVGRDWLIDLTYARYGIRSSATITTATPVVGDIARTLDVRSDPDVIGVLLGYRF